MNKNRWHTVLISSVCASAFLAGCSIFQPVKQPDNYILAIPVMQVEKTIPANVVVQAVDGRAQYLRRSITVNPQPYRLTTYPDHQWAASPCEMALECMISYLGSTCDYVAPSRLQALQEAGWIVITYIDVFDQVKRDNRWYADCRIRYEIVSAKSNQSAGAWIYERSAALPSGKVEDYVAAQNASFEGFLKELTTELTELAKK